MQFLKFFKLQNLISIPIHQTLLREKKWAPKLATNLADKREQINLEKAFILYLTNHLAKTRLKLEVNW